MQMNTTLMQRIGKIIAMACFQGQETLNCIPRAVVVAPRLRFITVFTHAGDALTGPALLLHQDGTTLQLTPAATHNVQHVPLAHTAPHVEVPVQDHV